ncbi:metallophosphoesterase [Anaerocolumna jejuensis]|uniref:metallophosphoesterase n=1 Tax=Anaerocolumna jejuensis TaxID=259063 RepID=UPI003F7B3B3A
MIKIIGALILLLLLIEYIRNLKPEITEENVESERLPQVFDGFRMVILADLHNYSFGKGNEVLKKQIDSVKPDLILVAGDMLVRKAPKKYDTAFELLKALSRKYPIYYGLGNHEQSLAGEKEEYAALYREYVNKLEKEGIIFLDNESVILRRKNDNLKITGLSIEKDYYGKCKIPEMPADYIENLVGKCERQCYNILIAHNPVYFKNYAAYGSDLILAGHVHGGIIRLPFLGGMLSPQYRFFPKYDAGRFHEKESTMLISRGLGLHTLKFRIGNRPELMTITLKRK